MPKYKTNMELLNAINKEVKASGQPGIPVEEINASYFGKNGMSLKNQRDQQQMEKAHDAYEKISTILENRHAVNKHLTKELPNVFRTKSKEHMDKLREQAHRTAEAHAKKMEANQINLERKAAQLERENAEKKVTHEPPKIQKGGLGL